METFGFFEAIAHETTRIDRAQPASKQLSESAPSQHQPQPTESPSPKAALAESVVEPDQAFAWWGMF